MYELVGSRSRGQVVKRVCNSAAHLLFLIVSAPCMTAVTYCIYIYQVLQRSASTGLLWLVCESTLSDKLCAGSR
jgi:hypothetical protein